VSGQTDLARALAVIDAWDRDDKGTYVDLANLFAAAFAEVRRDALAPVLAEGDPDARMDAYYYGFDRTGVGIVDDDGLDGGPSYAEQIQAAANRAAERIREAAGGAE
jgi:hypothetical protein